MISQRTPVLDRRAHSAAAHGRRTWIFLVALTAAVGVAPGPRLSAASAPGASGPAPAAAASTQTSDGGGVTIQVTWDGPASGSVFRVGMNTHSVDLDQYDLRALAVLRTDQGTEVRPSAWDAPKGGHHRAGVLTFPAQGPNGKAVLGPDVHGISLIVRGIAGVPERTFRWTW